MRIMGVGLGAESSADQRTARAGEESARGSTEEVGRATGRPREGVRDRLDSAGGRRRSSLHADVLDPRERSWERERTEVAGAEVVVRIMGVGLGAESSADQRTASAGEESGSHVHFPGRPAPLTRSGGAGRSGNTFVLAEGSRQEAPETRPDPGVLSERGPGIASRDDGEAGAWWGEARAEDRGSGATGVQSPRLAPEKRTGSPAIGSTKKMASEGRALPAPTRGSTEEVGRATGRSREGVGDRLDSTCGRRRCSLHADVLDRRERSPERVRTVIAGAEVVVRIMEAGLGAESSVGEESGSHVHFPGRPAPLTRSGGAGRSGNTFVLAVGWRQEAPETRPGPGLLSERGPGIASRDDGEAGAWWGEARAEDRGSGATGVQSPHLAPEKRTGSPAIGSTKKMAPEGRALPARARPGSTMTSPARQNRHHGTCGLVKSPDSAGSPGRGPAPSSPSDRRSKGPGYDRTLCRFSHAASSPVSPAR